MNNKHLASLLLFLVMFGLCYGVLSLNKKKQAAEEEADAALSKLAMTSNLRTTAQEALAKTRETTAPLRKYYRMWLPEFEKTDSEIKAKNNFQQTIKRIPNLVFFDQGMNPLMPNKDAVYVAHRASGRAKFVGEYQKSLQLLSMIERELPTSRIASVEIRKGDRANDVEVNLLVEFPVIAAPPIAKK
jgi:hypothetical protein